MSDDPVMKMYEAQAIAMEKQDEIDRLNKEKEELEERLRRVDLGREANPAISNNKLDEATVNELKMQIADVAELLANLKEQNLGETNNLHKKCAGLGNVQGTLGTSVNNLKKQTQNIVKDMKEQDKQNRMFRLKLEEISQKVDRMETTVSKQADRFASIEGKVEIISRQINGETILIMGGLRGGKKCSSMAVLSAGRSKWIELQLQLPYETYCSGAVYLNGEIYLFGGYYNPKVLYKLDKNMKWIRLADMNEERAGITNSCLEWNGHIWVFGGRNEKDEFLKSVERYDPKENKWTQMPHMNSDRAAAAATLWNDKIIISGGWSAETTVTNTMECFNPNDNCSINLFDMPQPLGGHSLISCKNKLIVMGGRNGNAVQNTVWEVEPSRDKTLRSLFLQSNHTRRSGFKKLSWRWPLKSKGKSLESMKYPSRNFAGIVLDNEIYAIGGYQGGILPYLSRVEIFDGKSWRDGPSLPYTWSYMSAVIIPKQLTDRLYNYNP